MVFLLLLGEGMDCFLLLLLKEVVEVDCELLPKAYLESLGKLDYVGGSLYPLLSLDVVRVTLTLEWTP